MRRLQPKKKINTMPCSNKKKKKNNKTLPCLNKKKKRKKKKKNVMRGAAGEDLAGEEDDRLLPNLKIDDEGMENKCSRCRAVSVFWRVDSAKWF